MALNTFDLIIGGQKGNKMVEGTISLVTDNYTITTGLTEVRAASISPLMNTSVGGHCEIVSKSGGNVVVSLTNNVGVAIASVQTVMFMATGY